MAEILPDDDRRLIELTRGGATKSELMAATALGPDALVRRMRAIRERVRMLRGPRERVSDEESQLILRLHREGVSQAEIGRRVDRPAGSIFGVLERLEAEGHAVVRRKTAPRPAAAPARAEGVVVRLVNGAPVSLPRLRFLDGTQ